MTHKQLFSIAMVLLAFVLIFVVAEKVVMPVYGEYEELKANYVASVELQKVTATQLSDVKNIVRTELNSQDINCLYAYIQETTSNLTKSTMKNIAGAIVTHSWEAKLPLGIMVAIAQTRSNFNPTKLNGSLRGIYQIDEFEGRMSKASRLDLHTIDKGVKIACELMVEKMGTTMTWAGTLEEFNFQKTSHSFITDVFKNTTNFVAFQHDYAVKVQDALDIEAKVALEAAADKTKEG